jgi:uncharacterized protein (DUF1800 family)
MDHLSSRRELAARALRRARTTTTLRRAAAPTTIPFEHHLLARATFGRNEATLAELTQLGVHGWLTRQLDPQAIDDSAAERLVGSTIDPWLAAAPDVRLLARAIHSRRQLAWRLVHFLNNHFATFRGATAAISESNEDDQFYKVCSSDFATVLRASATSPAMIDFLDSRSNVAGNPNENYARELLELHTLGVNGGYTEADVAAVARVFTGWSRINVRGLGASGPITDSRFQFYPNRHDTGAKSLSIGWSTPGISGPGGYQEGLQLLDFLAAHPSTAAHVTLKLCRYFVADQPAPGLLQRVQQVFTQERGAFKPVLEAILLDPEFAAPGVVKDKVHDGFEWIANLVRRFEIGNPNTRTLNTEVGVLGGQPHTTPVPTGHPETGDEWQGAGNLLPRWTFADDLVHDRLAGVRVPWTTLYRVLPASPAAWVDSLLQRLVDGDVPATTAPALTVFMTNRLATLPPAPTLTQVLPHLRDLAAIVIRLPESQLS